MAGNGQKVIELDRQRMDAMAKKDLAKLNELIADDLVYTHSSARFHVADQALLGVEPGRGVGVDEVVGDQLVELGEVLLRHRVHALPVELDDLLPVACHWFLLFVLSGPSAPACLAGGAPR